MVALSDLPERCTVEEAALLLREAAAELGLPGEPPSIRTLRLWRTKRLLSPGDRRMSRRNLLEALAMIRLVAEGMSTAAAAERARDLPELRLIRYLASGDDLAGPAVDGPPPEITLRLLALGLLAQYRAVVEQRAIVGSMEPQNERQNTPIPLRRAMALLGRHFFEEGVKRPPPASTS